MKLSVIISTKNRRSLLADAMRGLAAQTLDPSTFEVIILDNLSTEDIAGLVEEWRTRVGFEIRYHRMPVDGGPSPSRNEGARMARGGILAFTDSDCRPAPGWLAAGLAAMESGVDFVSGVVLYKPEQRASFFSKLSAERTWEHPGFPTANIFYRRDLFLSHGGFDVTMCFRDPFDRAVECADTDLAWRMIDAGCTRAFVPEALVYHEIEQLTPKLWLLEPTRLFVVPLLIRKHPQLRNILLKFDLFFYPGTAVIYLAILLLPLAFATQPTWLLLALPLLVARQIGRHGIRRPRAVLTGVIAVVPNVGRMAVMAAALLYGSARYRCLVL